MGLKKALTTQKGEYPLRESSQNSPFEWQSTHQMYFGDATPEGAMMKCNEMLYKALKWTLRHDRKFLSGKNS